MVRRAMGQKPRPLVLYLAVIERTKLTDALEDAAAMIVTDANNTGACWYQALHT